MTQEQKDLLLKDLCARLPYGVKAQVKYPINTNDECIITTKEITSVNCRLEMVQAENIDIIVGYYIFEVKPYLFPLSSMTEEQKNNCPIGETNLNIIKSNIGHGIIEIPWKLSYIFIEWCNKNHFDYRGLIPMGLAKDATKLKIY